MALNQMISIIQCSPDASVVLLPMEGLGAVWGKVVVAPSSSSSSGSALWVTSHPVSSSSLSLGSGQRRVDKFHHLTQCGGLACLSAGVPDDLVRGLTCSEDTGHEILSRS